MLDDHDRDRYSAFYAEHLWGLIPEVYRASDGPGDDSGRKGPLRELVERLGGQAAVVRRSIDRSLEDQSIESCDDWLIPYLGDLLATKLVAGLDARGRRLDVAKTIYYRRRKGTVAILEEIAADVTGWNARVVEFFRRLARHRHGFDPEIGLDREQAVIEGLRGSLSGTPAGGFADLRHAGAAQSTATAFDEFYHSADFRRGRGTSGWHNIPKLGVFLWRLRSFRYALCEPVEDSACPGQFTFDPTGREVPLFAREFRDPSQYGDAWVTPDEWMLPGPIRPELLRREAARLYPDSLAVGDVSLVGETVVPFADLRLDPERGRFVPNAPPLAGANRRVSFHQGFMMEVGAGTFDRRALPMEPLPEPAPAGATVVGGGSNLQAALSSLGVSGTLTIGDSLTYPQVLNCWNVTDVLLRGGTNERPVIRLNGGAWLARGILNARLAIEGVLFTGADLILRGSFDTVTLSCVTIDPGQEVGPGGVMPRTVDGRDLRPSTIWIEGLVGNLVLRRSITGPIRVRGSGALGRLTASDSIIQGVRTIEPAALTTLDVLDARRFARRLKDGGDPLATFLRASFPAPLAAQLAAYDPSTAVPAPLLDSIVAGLNATLSAGAIYQAARFAGIPLPPALVAQATAGPVGPAPLRVNRLLLEAAFPQELQPSAVATVAAEVSFERTTVLGRVVAHRIGASESILNGFAVATDPQEGCVRFSAYAPGSLLHQPYESVEVAEDSAILLSRRFGRPDYAQLSPWADREIVAGPPGGSILAGSKDGSEMGVFALAKNPIKERGLRLKLSEFMPIGLSPVLIYVT